MWWNGSVVAVQTSWVCSSNPVHVLSSIAGTLVLERIGPQYRANFFLGPLST